MQSFSRREPSCAPDNTHHADRVRSLPTAQLQGQSSLVSCRTREPVLLVHGHGAHPVLLEPLRRALARRLSAINWRYPSLRGSIEKHATPARPGDRRGGRRRAASLSATAWAPSWCARGLRGTGRASSAASCCFPPNRGALPRAGLRHSGSVPWPAAARELCSHPGSYVNGLEPAADLDCGIIAASWDHAVSLASTHLPGERDHITLRGLHTLPLHWRAPVQVAHFLREGRFRHAAG